MRSTIKDSEFVGLVLSHLGKPEAWCQRAWFRAGPTLDYTVDNTNSPRPNELYRLSRNGVLQSVCLDSAVTLTTDVLAASVVRENGVYGTDRRAAVRNEFQWQADDVRRVIYTQMIEQFPDIVAEFVDARQEDEERKLIATVKLHHIKAFLDGTPRRLHPSTLSVSSPESLMPYLNIPFFNDHPAMTYEGVRSVLEKTKLTLEEQGR